MSVIMDRHGTVIHRSGNLSGLRDHARRTPVVGVTVRDTDGRSAELHRELMRTGEDRPYRRYEYLVQYRNGDIGRAFFADWRVAAQFTVDRRSWRTHRPLSALFGAPRRALEVESDVPGFMDLYARLCAPWPPRSIVGRLPVRDDVQTTTYHRNNPVDGLTYYREFPIEDVLWPGTRIAKRWVKADDGLRYYR